MNGVGSIYGHNRTLTSALSSLPAPVLQRLSGLMQQMHISLISGILHWSWRISAGKNMWIIFLFCFFLYPSASEGPYGSDVMRWSTEKAIYPLFVLLRSFKKANSLKANRGSNAERREIHLISSSTSSESSWLKLHVCILSQSLKWEACRHACNT